MKTATRGVTEVMCRWIVNTTYDDLPTEAVMAAKRAMLDTLGVTLAGATQPVGRIVINYTRDAGGEAEAGVIAGGMKTTVANAAFASGVMAHALDFDDIWLPVSHPSCTVFPAALALGEKQAASGKQLIEAFVVGLEIHGKTGQGLGKWVHMSTPGFHTTAIFGVMAAAVASAKLLRLDEWKTRMALAIAASHASGILKGSGTMVKAYHAGNASSGGVRAALLARQGFTGDPDVIGGPRGYAETFMGRGRYDPQATIAGLGNPFHVVFPGIGVKKYPCCYLIHRALDAILRLVMDYDVRPEQVEEVVVTVPHEGWQNRSEVDDGMQAKFSLQYNMAEAILARKIVIESFEDAYVNRPEAKEMMKRVRLEVDPSVPQEYHLASNPVTMSLKDGRLLNSRVDVPHGDWGDPMSLDELLAKYRDNALRVLSPRNCQRTVDLMLGLEKLEDIGELAEIYTQSPASRAL